MKKRRRKFSTTQAIIIITLLSISIILSFLSIFVLPTSPTGFGSQSVANVILGILGQPKINITHPYDNYTYNFSGISGPNGPFILDLNVTSNQPMDYWDNWIFRLYDLKHNEWEGSALGFTPNTTFNAVRWGNQLFVNASEDGRITRDNVTFYVWYHNTAPILGPIKDPIYVCEESSLNYNYYAEDADEEYLNESLTGGQSIFHVERNGILGNRTFMTLFSGLIVKGQVGLNKGNKTFLVTLSVIDRYPNHSDSKSTNITILEINNPPTVGNIGVQTLWNTGDDSTLFEIIDVFDKEYALGYGNLSFNKSIKNSIGQEVGLFNVSFNGTDYYINFSALGYSPEVYDVLICFNDTGILIPHPNLTNECNQTGGSQTSCEYFELTITDMNRPPTIIDFYPNNSQTINITGGNTAYFNITKYDPDGTIPDAYWYVDDRLVEYDAGNTSDEFYLRFGCGVSGEHVVKAEITDGELNDSVEWTFNVKRVACTVPGDGGGGGGGIPSCTPLWACADWGICQHAQTSLEVGILSGDDYRTIEGECLAVDLDEVNCGFQIRFCDDLNNCALSFGKPHELRWCHYTEKPSCNDGIKNCHSGECELLVDCGGPCEACPSCTDNTRNQGEEGVDCGGPCPWKCPVEVPLLKRREIWYFLGFLLLIIIIIIIVKLARVLKYKKGLETKKKAKV